MKTKNMITAFALTAMAAACTPGSKQLSSGIDIANLDTTYLPGTDFYMYATGGWQKAHPLTAEYSRFGSFDQLQEDNNERLRSLIEGVAAQENEAGSIAQKIADLYNSAMDSVSLNENYWDALAEFLQCDGYQSSPEVTAKWLAEVWPRMERQGVNGLFGMYIGADEKDSKNNIVNIVQGGLTLGQKDYYLDQDEKTVEIRKAYQKYIADLSQHMGFAEKDAQRIAEDVLRIETRLAVASKSRTELRDPEANYNKMAYDEFKQQYAGIDWDNFFGNLGMEGIKDICLGQPDAIREVEKVMKEETPEALQVTANLLSLSSLTIVLFTVVQATSSILQGLHKQRIPMYTLLIGVALKIALNYTLVGIPGVDIHGAPFASLLCYTASMIPNLYFVCKHTGYRFHLMDVLVKPLGCSAVMGGVVFALWHFLFGDPGKLHGAWLLVGILLCVIAGVAVYAALAIFTKTIRKEDVPAKLRRFFK